MARLLGAWMLLAALLVSATAAEVSASARAADGLGIRQPSTSGEYRGRKVGARTEVRDVESDAEVQELGRFSIGEYNRHLRGGGTRLEFGRVVAAQRQVVSGLKYYLRVAATENAAERAFDAVVVVKPWLEKRTLLTFAPAAAK